MEDEAIIDLFFSRSERAIAELGAKYGKLLYQLSLRILDSPSDAEECVNDTYLGAWNAIPPARPELLPAYLCRIVRNISLTRCQARKAAKRSGMQELAIEELEAAIASPGSVEDTVEARELARMLERFLDTLSGQNRVIFLRRYWFYDSCAEIAVLTGLSEKNITVRLTRIRARLKKYLKEREVYL